jgi:hypothetical protein
MDAPSYTAFHLRLQWLQSIISGPPSTVNGASLSYYRSQGSEDTTNGADGKIEEEQDRKDITQRTGDLAQDLRNAVFESGHESLRRLVDECELFFLPHRITTDPLPSDRRLASRNFLPLRRSINTRRRPPNIHKLGKT